MGQAFSKFRESLTFHTLVLSTGTSEDDAPPHRWSGDATKKDMALCFVIFNPARTRRLIMNYCYVVNEFKRRGFPTYTIELVFSGRQPEIADSLRVHGSSILFHKEKLFRILERRIPPSYHKIALLDADILFDDASWYTKTSALLDTHDVVQPFENAHWLDIEYKRAVLSRPSVVKMQSAEYDSSFHPGFAWCFRRDYYRKVGFFDLAVSGSGDTLSAAAWLGKTIPKKSKSLPECVREAHAAFCKLKKPRIAFLKGCDVFHLFHGPRRKRMYQERHELLKAVKNIRDILTENADGVYEWKDRSWNDMFYEYFIGRDDDGLEVGVRCKR